jgi:hypothetical protein
MNYKVVGALRGLLTVVIVAVLSWAGQSENLSFLGNPPVIALVVAVASALEHAIEETKGTALFGAAKV